MKHKRLKRNVFVFWIFFLLIGAVIVIYVPKETTGDATPDHYVDPTSNNPMSPYTTPNTACHTIQPAINVAGSGDTVHITDATYKPTSTITINTNNINLQGQSTSATIIDGSSFSGSGQRIMIDISADDVDIDKFTIKSKTGLPYSGVTGIGIKMLGSTTNYINNCDISNIDFPDNYYGIWMRFAGQNSNNYNTFENIDFSTSPYNWLSIYLDRCNHNKFTDIEITQSTSSSTDAIQLTNADNNEFIEVNITQNKGSGFHLSDDCDNNEIKESIIQNADHGIFIEDTTSGNQNCNDNLIFNNIIKDNSIDGIRIDHCTDNEIFTNKIYDSGVGYQDYGIYLKDWADNNVIYDNHDDRTIQWTYSCGIHDNVNEGILIDNSNGNMINGNTIEDNGGYAVKIIDNGNGKSNTVANNNIIGNGVSFQAYDDSAGSNTWNLAYGTPIGLGNCGNYWSDNPSTTDVYSGQNQDQPGSDGICDVPYSFTNPGPNGIIVDYYPFVNKISNPTPPPPPE